MGCSSAPYSFSPKYQVGDCVKSSDDKIYLVSEIIKRKRYELVELVPSCINNILEDCSIQELKFEDFDKDSKLSQCH